MDSPLGSPPSSTLTFTAPVNAGGNPIVLAVTVSTTPASTNVQVKSAPACRTKGDLMWVLTVVLVTTDDDRYREPHPDAAHHDSR